MQNCIVSIVKLSFDQSLIGGLRGDLLKIVVIELDEIIKFYELIQRIVGLVLVLFDKVLVSLLDWRIKLICDIVKTRSIIYKNLIREVKNTYMQ